MLNSDTYWVYTSHWPDAEAQNGIGIFQWSSLQGKLTPKSNYHEIAQSSYLAVHPEHALLYSIDNQHIDGFSINASTGALSNHSRIQVDGMDGCYLSLSTDGKYLLVAYYSSGNIASYQLAENGALMQMADEVRHSGTSINKDRQEAAHPHMIIPIPQTNLILVPDLGIDQIKCYQLNDDGTFIAAPIPFAHIKPGYGPRHVAFHPNKPLVYVLAELESRVVGFHMDPNRGIAESFTDLSMLPQSFNDFTKAADIHITPDGKYLYASNRGHDSLAIMNIDDQGVLSLVDIVACGGSWPRAFAIDPSGEYLLVANKRSNHISVNKIDSSTGHFQEVEKVNTPTAPQCIRFLASN